MRKRFSSFGGFHGPPYIDSEHLVIIDDEPNQQVFDDYDSLVGELERAELEYLAFNNGVPQAVTFKC